MKLLYDTLLYFLQSLFPLLSDLSIFYFIFVFLIRNFFQSSAYKKAFSGFSYLLYYSKRKDLFFFIENAFFLFLFFVCLIALVFLFLSTLTALARRCFPGFSSCHSASTSLHGNLCLFDRSLTLFSSFIYFSQTTFSIRNYLYVTDVSSIYRNWYLFSIWYVDPWSFVPNFFHRLFLLLHFSPLGPSFTFDWAQSLTLKMCIQKLSSILNQLEDKVFVGKVRGILDWKIHSIFVHFFFAKSSYLFLVVYSVCLWQNLFFLL